MDEELKKRLAKDTDGLLTYEYIANHIGDCDDIIDELVDNMIAVDPTGQFTVSAARYLSAIEHDKDRERRYIGDLLQSIWGADYAERAAELSASDNNFRRIYKRLFPASAI